MVIEQSDDDAALLSYKKFAHALSGSLASVFAITVLYPFETARTRLQVDDGRRSVVCTRLIAELVREEGFAALYRGWRSLVVSLSVTNFVYFYVFHGLKLYAGSTYDSQSTHKDLLFGLIAGIAAVLVSNPLWVVNVRLKIQGAKLKTEHIPTHYAGIIDGLVQIARKEGPLALWGSVFSSLILATNPAIHFMIYEGLKRNTMHHLLRFFNASSLYFTFGAVSKLSATVVTYPIQLVQARSRSGMDISNLMNRKALQLRNVTMWFRGMESKLVQTVLTSALMQLTYEHIVRLTFILLGLSLPSPATVPPS